MTKQVNPNIGHIECAECREVAALRKNKTGGLYYDCLNCGRLAPNHAGGQAKIKDRAVIWGPQGAPAGVPKWIAEQWPYALAIRNRDDGAKHATLPSAGAQLPGAGAPRQAPRPTCTVLPEAPPPPPTRKPQGSPKKTPEPPANARGFAFLED